EISEVRVFSVGDQRTIPAAVPGEVLVHPVRELLISDEVATRAGRLATENAGNPELAEVFDKISQHTPVQGMESLIPVLYDGPMQTLPELMPAGTHTVVLTPAAVQRRAEDLV